MAKKLPKIDIATHPEFRVIHVNGAFGGLRPDEGYIKFYLNIVQPRIKTGGKFGEMEVDKITREFQVEVRMSTITFVGLADWMQKNIKELEKKGILKKGKRPSEAAETYRV